MQCSKQVYFESTVIFYGENRFFILADEVSHGDGFAWIRKCYPHYQTISNEQLRLMKDVTVVYWANQVFWDRLASSRLLSIWKDREDMKRLVITGYKLWRNGLQRPRPEEMAKEIFGPLSFLRNVKQVLFSFNFVRIDGKKLVGADEASRYLDDMAKLMMK